jgi:hypothetical protein
MEEGPLFCQWRMLMPSLPPKILSEEIITQRCDKTDTGVLREERRCLRRWGHPLSSSLFGSTFLSLRVLACVLNYIVISSIVSPNGIEKTLPIGELNEYEGNLMQAANPELQESITKVGRHRDDCFHD